MIKRRDRQVDRRTKAAAFRDQKSLDDFDFNFNTMVKRKPIYDLAAGDFVRKHRDAILVGPPSVRKSHLIQSIGKGQKGKWQKGVRQKGVKNMQNGS